MNKRWNVLSAATIERLAKRNIPYEDGLYIKDIQKGIDNMIRNQFEALGFCTGMYYSETMITSLIARKESLESFRNLSIKSKISAADISDLEDYLRGLFYGIQSSMSILDQDLEPENTVLALYALTYEAASYYLTFEFNVVEVE
jgi:hypothetical protein